MSLPGGGGMISKCGIGGHEGRAAREHRGLEGRAEGRAGRGERAARVHGVLGASAARSPGPRAAAVEGDRGGRAPGNLGGAARRGPQRRGAAVLDHKLTNVLDQLPKQEYPRPERSCGSSLTPRPWRTASGSATSLPPRYRKGYPKAVEILGRDWERMVTFYRFPRTTGRTCGHRTSSSRPSRRCDCGPTRPSGTRRSPMPRR